MVSPCLLPPFVRPGPKSGKFAQKRPDLRAFNGAGDTTTPTWMNLFCFWMLQIPLAVLLAENELGPASVFWSVAISESVLAVVAAVLFRRGRWKTRVV